MIEINGANILKRLS